MRPILTPYKPPTNSNSNSSAILCWLPGVTTGHSTGLSAEELLAGHPKDDSLVAGHRSLMAVLIALPISFDLRSGRCEASGNRTAYSLRVRCRLVSPSI